MKAVALTEFGGPGVLRIIELPAPQAGPGQIRIRVTAAAVNPAVPDAAQGEFVGQIVHQLFAGGLSLASQVHGDQEVAGRRNRAGPGHCHRDAHRPGRIAALSQRTGREEKPGGASGQAGRLADRRNGGRAGIAFLPIWLQAPRVPGPSAASLPPGWGGCRSVRMLLLQAVRDPAQERADGVARDAPERCVFRYLAGCSWRGTVTAGEA